ncbi:CBS domain-containing protein [Asanoa sp. NPDC049573]|uniref:CBS domain-containing protein n=1 Tax=Asanoa sp. NPDC049573 TaxID=3155396 RepID=UPI00343B1293
MRQWTVEDVMTRDVVSVAPDASYREVVNALIDRAVSAAPVVDAVGRVVGVVSEADLLHKVEAVGDERHRRIFGARRHADAPAAVAAELMTSPAVVIEPDTSIVAAARLLESKRIKRMPVVDRQRRLVGIVSRRDLLRIHTRTDTDIRAEIVDNVLVRTLWIDPVSVEVDVVDGVVALGGRVETRSLAGLAVEMAAEVAGVVEVIDRLTWEQDDSRAVHSRGYSFGTPEHLMRPSTN